MAQGILIPPCGGSNPPAPANTLKRMLGFCRLDKTDRPERAAYIGRTKVGTIQVACSPAVRPALSMGGGR